MPFHQVLPSGMTKLHKAAMENNVAYIDENPISKHALLDIFLGNTPLLCGVANSSVEFVLKLLDSPDTAHINTKSNCVFYLNSPLILSISKGWTHISTRAASSQPQAMIAKKLLEKQSEVNATDKHGRTALHYAFLHRHEDAISALLNANADLYAQDENGLTPLDYCFLNEKIAINILKSATGGGRGNTFTLNAGHFEESYTATFYERMALLHGYMDLVEKFHQMEYFNSEMSQAMSGLDEYIKALAESDLFLSHINTPHFQALLGVQQQLKKAIAISIFSDQSKGFLDNKKRVINQIVTQALADPNIKDEYYLIKEASVALLNILSIFGGGLPLLANYYYTGRLFFSAQPSAAEQCLKKFSDKSQNIFTIIEEPSVAVAPERISILYQV